MKSKQPNLPVLKPNRRKSDLNPNFEDQFQTLIIDISNSFFNLNNIEINGEKSKLLVINPPVTSSTNTITMGTIRPAEVLPSNPKEPLSDLGAWFSATNSFPVHLHVMKHEMQ